MYILKYLTTHFPFDPEMLSVAGYAEHRPIATNSTADGRSMNRRVDIVIMSESERQQEPPTEEQAPQPQ
jgi:chemotaxis protein MotB